MSGEIEDIPERLVQFHPGAREPDRVTRRTKEVFVGEISRPKGSVFPRRPRDRSTTAIGLSQTRNMPVTLTKELEQYVKTKLQCGRYADESEVWS